MDLEQLLFDEMVRITSDKSVGNNTDYALIESFRSYLTKDPQESFNHLVKAASMILEITDENALVLSNIHANLWAYYQRFGMLNEAKAHLEKAITILSKYELMGMHDSILQALNYSSVLVDMGDYEEALDLLLEVENIINHLDYTTFEHANTCHMIGITYLAIGRISEAKERFNQAMKIYAELFQDSPGAVYQKRGEISEHFLAMGLDEEAERFLNG